MTTPTDDNLMRPSEAAPKAEEKAIGTPAVSPFEALIAEDKANKAAKPAKEPKAKKEKPAALQPEGLVVYTDAGTKPNPGFGGWGIHGYLYNNAPPKKGTGNPAVLLTAEGYVLKAQLDGSWKPTEVTPLKYVDGVGTIPHCSNNGG